MGRKLAPHDVDRLERLMCESHREASRRVERRRQWTSANLGVEGVPEAFSNDERNYAVDPLFREILDEHAESINAVHETVAADTAPLTDRFAETAVQSTPSALTLVPIDATVAIADLAVRQAPLPSADFNGEHALQPGTDRVSDVVTWGALVNAYIDDRRDSAGRCGSEDQIRTVEKIMVHVLGSADTLTTCITQTHLGRFAKTLRLLPTRWGKTSAELLGGVAASLALAAKLPADAVGLSSITEIKHFSYLQQILNHGKAHGLGIAAALDLTNLKNSRSKDRKEQKARRGRDNWTPEEFVILLTAPPYTGSKGPKRGDRYKAGPYLYHDAAYWIPIILGLTGGRSAEFAGIPLDDIKIDADVPFFDLIEHADRSLKTAASRRQVPIHPELERLGFYDYVKALRQAREHYLFPELQPMSETASWATNYYKGFSKLRDWAFPDGTPWRHVVGGIVRDKDVHSIRGTVITLMLTSGNSQIVEEIVGHSDISSASSDKEVRKLNPITKSYVTPSLMAKRLKVMRRLTVLTAHLQPIPVKLNSIRPMQRKP